MEQIELLKQVVKTLESLRITYMVVGSYGSGAWGEPRFTYDIDIVISLPLTDYQRLVNAFPLPDYYVSSDAVKEAIVHRGQFNIIHSTSGHKIDFMIEGQNEWEKIQLARREKSSCIPVW